MGCGAAILGRRSKVARSLTHKSPYDHVPFAGPKYPLAGNGKYDSPSPSAVLTNTVFPHQSGKEKPG